MIPKKKKKKTKGNGNINETERNKVILRVRKESPMFSRMLFKRRRK